MKFLESGTRLLSAALLSAGLTLCEKETLAAPIETIKTNTQEKIAKLLSINEVLHLLSKAPTTKMLDQIASTTRGKDILWSLHFNKEGQYRPPSHVFIQEAKVAHYFHGNQILVHEGGLRAYYHHQDQTYYFSPTKRDDYDKTPVMLYRGITIKPKNERERIAIEYIPPKKKEKKRPIPTADQDSKNISNPKKLFIQKKTIPHTSAPSTQTFQTITQTNPRQKLFISPTAPQTPQENTPPQTKHTCPKKTTLKKQTEASPKPISKTSLPKPQIQQKQTTKAKTSLTPTPIDIYPPIIKNEPTQKTEPSATKPKPQRAEKPIPKKAKLTRKDIVNILKRKTKFKTNEIKRRTTLLQTKFLIAITRLSLKFPQEIMTSSIRTKAENQSTPGASQTSLHRCGRAADYRISKNSKAMEKAAKAKGLDAFLHRSTPNAPLHLHIELDTKGLPCHVITDKKHLEKLLRSKTSSKRLAMKTQNKQSATKKN